MATPLKANKEPTEQDPTDNDVIKCLDSRFVGRKDDYTILGIDKSANYTQLRTAYRENARVS